MPKLTHDEQALRLAILQTASHHTLSLSGESKKNVIELAKEMLAFVKDPETPKQS